MTRYYRISFHPGFFTGNVPPRISSEKCRSKNTTYEILVVSDGIHSVICVKQIHLVTNGKGCLWDSLIDGRIVMKTILEWFVPVLTGLK
jgi:hypothetical protein